MSRQAYELIPFEADAERRLSGAVTRQQQRLEIEYRLSGAINTVRVRPPDDPPRRRNELWRNTCFELFATTEATPGYWEFNFSPSGDWNAYRFDTYRQGMREEARLPAPSIECSRHTGILALTATLDLSGLIALGTELQLGVSAVIESTEGNTGFWALSHAIERPDFHRREGFELRID